MKSKSKITGMTPFSDDKYMVEDALRTLTRAKEIERDKALMAKVRKLARERLAEMKAVASGGGK
jgi:hypothetical protein